MIQCKRKLLSPQAFLKRRYYSVKLTSTNLTKATNKSAFLAFIRSSYFLIKNLKKSLINTIFHFSKFLIIKLLKDGAFEFLNFKLKS